MTSKRTPGWAVYITGERIDLDDLREQLKPPFDPWVEEPDDSQPDALFLRSKSWDRLEDGTPVAAEARRLVEKLNGSLPLLHRDAIPIKLGAVVRFDSDGKTRLPVIVASAGLSVGEARMRGRATVGPVVELPPNESKIQKWIRTADDDVNPFRSELLVHLSRPNNWFDLYKVIELFERIHGGEHAVQPLLANDWKEYKRIKHTANTHRHAPGTKSPPPIPATLKEAMAFLRQIIPKAL